jgi:hypothetical protein
MISYLPPTIRAVNREPLVLHDVALKRIITFDFTLRSTGSVQSISEHVHRNMIKARMLKVTI